MFFYTSLFVASVIVALVVVWLFNAIMDVGKQVYRAMLPSSKDNLTSHVHDVPLNTTINDTPTPWGWKSHETPRNAAKTHAATPIPAKSTPWGWPGNEGEVRKHGPEHVMPNGSRTEADMWGLGGKAKSTEPAKLKVGWPYREEKFEFAGKSYKVSRKRKVRKTDLSKTGKPWGW